MHWPQAVQCCPPFGQARTQAPQCRQISPVSRMGSGSSSQSVKISPSRTRGPNFLVRKTLENPISPSPQPAAMTRTLHTTSGGTLSAATGSRVVPLPSGTAG